MKTLILFKERAKILFSLVLNGFLSFNLLVIVIGLTEKNLAQETPVGKYFIFSSIKVTFIINVDLIILLSFITKARPSESILTNGSEFSSNYSSDFKFKLSEIEGFFKLVESLLLFIVFPKLSTKFFPFLVKCFPFNNKKAIFFNL
jgi:hypothetical protein